MRLITADNVTVDESVLTGESFAVIKDDIVNKKNIDNDTCVLF
jgi:magnesium-transporting ATPase (P-type)